MIAPSPEPAFAIFDFPLSRADFLVLHREIVAVSPEWRTFTATQRKRANRYFFSGFLGIPLGVVPLVAFAFDLTRRDDHVLTGLCVAAASAGLVYMGSNIRTALKDQIDGKSLAEKSSTDAYDWGAWRIECYNDGVRLTTPFRDTFSRWALFTGVTEFPSFVVLEEVGRGAYAIPKRLFATPGAATTFIKTVRFLLRERGAGVADRIRAYLERHDVRCPGCQYALRGSTGIVCPECGLALTLANVPAAVEQPPEEANIVTATLPPRE